MTVRELFHVCDDLLPQTTIQFFKVKEAKAYFSFDFENLSFLPMTYEEALDDEKLKNAVINRFTITNVDEYRFTSSIMILLRGDEK